MKNKTIWIVVVVLLAIGGYYWLKSGGSISNPYTASQSSVSPSPSVKSPAKSSTGGLKATATPVGATPVGATKTYSEFVAEYANRIIQFNSSCQATPSVFVLKNNTSVLLDNRSNSARTITVDGKAYSFVAYGYKVVTLSSPTLPHTVKINCDSSVNVSNVTLEANISGQ